MNENDYKSQAAQITDLVKRHYSEDIEWTGDLFVDRDGEWMVFQLADGQGNRTAVQLTSHGLTIKAIDLAALTATQTP